MPERKRWLSSGEWGKFEELFWDVEGTSYFDVKELALDIAAEKNPELSNKLRKNKENISTILLVTLQAKTKKEMETT